MAQVRYAKNLFLRCMCIVYVSAFLSFYTQIPGLNGNQGIFPASSQLEGHGNNLSDQMSSKPTLVWLAPKLGLNTQYTLDIVAIAGTVISFLGVASQKFCIAPLYVLLWICYLSLFQVNPLFLGFQWDILLLESGFLCILLAPLTSAGRKKFFPSDTITFWSVRWLLFRLMFSSAVVKLTSGCPTWWDLSALTVHFESQCLPTWPAWFAHHLPPWFLKLSVVATYVIEGAIPLLFLLPLRRVRIFAFYMQLMFQMCIVLTGNYCFFNLLTIVLCLGLLDDEFFYKNTNKLRNKKATVSQARTASRFICFLLYAFIAVHTIRFFNIRLGPKWTIESNIVFTQTQFENILTWLVPGTMFYGLVSLGLVVAKSFAQTALENSTLRRKITSGIVTSFYTGLVLFVFGISLVPYSSIAPTMPKSELLSALRPIYSSTQKLHLTHSYGLFRRMTGVGGRPELIIEGSNNLKGPWEEYPFLYKPGDVNKPMAFVVPHQPRLDWQMWFAALSPPQHNPWLSNVVYRLLNGQPEVLQLLDTSKCPFQDKPPKYIRVSLYTYHYSAWTESSPSRWWHREKEGEYLPPLTKDSPALLQLLRQHKLIEGRDWPIKTTVLRDVLSKIRSVTDNFEGSFLIRCVLTAACTVIALAQ